jgi:hypothetical protein
MHWRTTWIRWQFSWLAGYYAGMQTLSVFDKLTFFCNGKYFIICVLRFSEITPFILTTGWVLQELWTVGISATVYLSRPGYKLLQDLSVLVLLEWHVDLVLLVFFRQNLQYTRSLLTRAHCLDGSCPSLGFFTWCGYGFHSKSPNTSLRLQPVQRHLNLVSLN